MAPPSVRLTADQSGFGSRPPSPGARDWGRPSNLILISSPIPNFGVKPPGSSGTCGEQSTTCMENYQTGDSLHHSQGPFTIWNPIFLSAPRVHNSRTIQEHSVLKPLVGGRRYIYFLFFISRSLSRSGRAKERLLGTSYSLLI